MSWKINVLAPAVAAIIKDAQYSGVQIGGSPKTPGTYSVVKGSTIYVYATIQNTGETQGSLWVWIRDKLSGKVLASKVDSVAPGGTLGIPATPIKADASMELYIEAGIGTTPGVNITDTWGC